MKRLFNGGAHAFWIRTLTIFAALSLSACASVYVDTATKEVAKNEFTVPAKPQPTYLAFEFQTKGAPNSRATDFLKTQIRDQVKSSGLFSQVVDQPAPDVAMLSITLNNIPVTEDAYAKGFVTGLTFGAAGSVVTDGYLCTVNYLAPGAKEPVVAIAKHAIHTAMGAANPPPAAVKANSIGEAVQTMARQIVDNALKNLSNEAKFVEN